MACNPAAYADQGSKGTPLAHFFPPFLWASKEMGVWGAEPHKSNVPSRPGAGRWKARFFYETGMSFFLLHDTAENHSPVSFW